MNSVRKQGLQAIVFGALAFLILFQSNHLPSRHPENLGIGAVMILLAVWEISRGKASLSVRSVKKSEEPTWFWLAIFFTVFVGMALIALSFA